MYSSGARRVVHIPQARFPEPRYRLRRALLLSIVFHALVIAALVWETSRPDAPVDVVDGTGGGGGGGGQVTYVALPPFQGAQASDAPVADEDVEEAEIVVPHFSPTVREIIPVKSLAVRVSRRQPAVARAVGALPGLNGGPGSGTGTGGGIGSGQGSGVGSGRGPGFGSGDVLPPTVRFSALPPMDNRPESLRGRSFVVLFTVNPDGRVSDVRTEPPIEDAAYRKKFLDAMRRYRFNPATRVDGSPVTGLATVTVTL